MNNITNVLISVSNIIPAFMLVMNTFCGILGLYLVGNSLHKYYILSNPQAAKSTISGSNISISGASLQIIIAIGLLSMANGDGNMQNILSSMLGMDTFNMPAELSLSGNNLNNTNFALIQHSLGVAIENIMILIGSMSIIKGLLIVRRINLGQSRENFSTVISFLIAGVLCLNIKQFAQILDNTFGLHFSRFF